MNNKILSFITALGLAAACLATSSAFAVGAFRIGGVAYVEGGVTVTTVVARAVASDDYIDGDAAEDDASRVCESARSPEGSEVRSLSGAFVDGDNLLSITPDINTNTGNCYGPSIHGNDRSSSTGTDTFTDECIVIVGATIDPGIDPFSVANYGIGIATTCQEALTNAETDCLNCNNPEALPLNGAGDVYLRDGSANVCNDNFYNFDDLDTAIDCRNARTSTQCRINDSAKPIYDGNNGVCVAATSSSQCSELLGMGFRKFVVDDPDTGTGSCVAVDQVGDFSVDGTGYVNREGNYVRSCGVYVEESDNGSEITMTVFNRQESAGDSCGACLEEHYDTGILIDPATGMEMAPGDPNPIRFTRCEPNLECMEADRTPDDRPDYLGSCRMCSDLNRFDRETEGVDCGACFNDFNDTATPDGACVRNETCIGDNDGIPNGTGGCTGPNTCPADENRVESANICRCMNGFIEPDEGSVCVLLCTEEGHIANGDQCIELFYYINGNLVTDDLNLDPVEGTEEEPFDIALAAVVDFSATVMITIFGGDDELVDIVYSKAAVSDTDSEQQSNPLIEQQSNELIVDSEGVITFDPETFNPDTPDAPVSPGIYNIVIAVNSVEGADNPIEEELRGPIYVTVQSPPVIVEDDVVIEQPIDDLEPSPVSESGGADLKIVLGVIGVGAWALYAYYWNVVPQYSWTPSYAFRNDNGNISYSVGSRWTATADNLQFYWQTSQSSASNGDQLVYGSGIKYNNGVFSAAMNSEGDSDETDLDISLLANKQLGLWQLKGGYNFDMQTSPTETDTQSRFNVAAQYSLNKWVLSTTANTNGDTASARFAARYTVDRWILSATTNTDGDTTSARINYSYRF